MRALMLTQRLPYAPNRGDRVRALNLLKVLARHVEIDLVSLVHTRAEAAHAIDLRGLTASVTAVQASRAAGYARAAAALTRGRALTHALLYANGLAAACRRLAQRRRPDVVFAYCSGLAPLAWLPELAGVPFVIDMVDVDSEKWVALADGAREPAAWLYRREARTLARFERTAADRAYAVLVVNDRERDAMRRLAPRANVIAVPNGVDVDALRPPTPPAHDARVTFCGVMNYRPNEQAAVWLAERVWPLVRERRPDAVLTLLGAHPTRSVRRLARLDGSIEVTGEVADTRPILWRSALSVAPLSIARGVQNKVLEAVAAGLPCVITPAVEGGLPAAVLPACRVAAPDPQPFAAAVLDLLERPPAERRAIAASADLRALTWAERLAPAVDIVCAAARPAMVPA